MKRLLVLVLVLVIAAPAAAQTATPTPTPEPTITPGATVPTRTARPTNIPGECGSGLPCGPLPWRLPSFPRLQSPTPFPTLLITAVTNTYTPGGPTLTATPTLTPTITLTPLPTSTYQFEDIEARLETMQAILDATALPVNVFGTPVDVDEQIASWGSSGVVLFGYLRSIGDIYMGPFAPLFVFTLFSMSVILTVKITRLVLPIISIAFNFVRRVVQFVMDLIPG